MTVIDTLSKMQQDAVEQLRAGDHNEFLVGFLTTSVMLELSNLVAADLDLATYAQAVVDILTQHAPIERCVLGLEPIELPAVAAAVGVSVEISNDPVALAAFSDNARIHVDGVGSGALHATDVPAALQKAGFVSAAANQIGNGLSRVVESERLRRKAAAAKTLRVVAGLDEGWSSAELTEIAQALASLPLATGVGIDASAARFAGTIVARAGRIGPHRLDRSLVVDARLEVKLQITYSDLPSADDIARLDEVVKALGAGLERIEQNIRLAAEADTDPLTGVGNRRRASKALAQARTMSDTRDEPMSVLLCDLDYFKQVNDLFGHDVGDAVLVKFAALLLASVRAHDTVIRWGGEEFLVVCPGCDQNGASSLAERLLAACPDACADELPPETRQTMSIGVAVYPAAARTPEALVSAADDALYRAKRGGRNQHCIAGS